MSVIVAVGRDLCGISERSQAEVMLEMIVSGGFGTSNGFCAFK